MVTFFSFRKLGFLRIVIFLNLLLVLFVSVISIVYVCTLLVVVLLIRRIFILQNVFVLLGWIRSIVLAWWYVRTLPWVIELLDCSLNNTE